MGAEDNKKCKRPCCTSCFVVIWVFVLFGVILSNASLGTLVPAIVDLPDNLIKGFGEALKFDYLREDSAKVRASSAAAVENCSAPVNVTVACQAGLAFYPGVGDSTAHKAEIQAAFANSLGIIQKVANDKYFGTEELEDTAKQLNNITGELDKLDGSMDCSVSVPIYCSIWDSASIMDAEVDTVDEEIDKFENNENMDTFRDRSEDIDGLHVVPWIFVTSLLFYCCFWFFGNGLCCCCRGGSCAKTLLLIPQVLCCLFPFILTLIWVALGFIVRMAVMKVELEEFKGKPTVEEMLVHIQDEFPEFWAIVFEDLESGLSAFWFGSCMFFIGIVTMTFYQLSVCICKPYQPPEEDKPAASSGPPAQAVGAYVPGQAVGEATV